MTDNVMYREDEDPLEDRPPATVCWVYRNPLDREEEIVQLVLDDLRQLGYLESDDTVNLRATPILMRVETDVEARIAGREGENCMLECTKRAKYPEPYWRVERIS